MNLTHCPESKYCFALDENTVRLRLAVYKDELPDKVTVLYGGKYDFATVRRSAEAQRECEDGLFVWYSATIKLYDRRLVYLFKIERNGKIKYFSEDGLTDEYDFDMNYYNCFQYAYVNGCDVMPCVEWMRQAVFYQIFVDRFNIGKKKDTGYINLKWGDRPTPKSFAGGDIAGITAKLEYIRSLGVNAIYLTPVFSSISNHKYDISDYYEIDKNFGDKNDLKRLIDRAHSLGMRVVLDAVFNHCSDRLAQFADVREKGRKSKYADWFIINGDNPLDYECFAACRYMPKFNTSNAEVREYLKGIATYWIREFDIDGWRLDVSDEVSHEFWREFRKAVKQEKTDCVLIGENWHDANPYLHGDQFDSIMNYAFTKACLDFYAFGKLTAEELAHRLNEILMRNTDTVNDMMLNLLDSHDTHRFLTRVDGNVNRLMSALCVTFFFRGAPCVYYGTENAMEGGYDPDCRRTFDWAEEGRDNPVKSLIKKLSAIKRDFTREAVIYSRGGKLIIERGSRVLTADKDGFEIK